jgi:hypothetical protein
MSQKIYVYKIVTDNGGAPCVWHGLLSLAICKPMIRKSAQKGDCILGFGGKSHYKEEPLIYIAMVTAKPKQGEYYTKQKYANRPDCIYYQNKNKASLKKSARFHNNSDQLTRDVGLDFENAHVLLSNDFRYFGNKATAEYKKQFRQIEDLVEKLKQGHRVNHPPKLYEELLKLINQTWQRNRQKKIGMPNDSDKSLICNR